MQVGVCGEIQSGFLRSLLAATQSRDGQSLGGGEPCRLALCESYEESFGDIEG